MNKKQMWIRLALLGFFLIPVLVFINGGFDKVLSPSKPVVAQTSQAVVNGQTLNVTVAAPNRGFDWWNLVWVGLGGTFLYIVYKNARQNSGQPDKHDKMKKNGAKRADLVSKTKFADVAGVDSAKKELEEIVEMLRKPQKFRRLGGKLPAGVLLRGGPGTGKTLLARAVAGEAGVPMFAVSGSEFVEMFVGVGAARVRDLFEEAKRHAPSIVFIDEIDVLGKSRKSDTGGGQEADQTLNQLLVCMDGITEAGADVIVIGATNRDDVMDPALLRAGRFDRHVTVPRPDTKGREAILKVHVKKVPLSADVNLPMLARETYGMVGASLMTVVNEAALAAGMRDAATVAMSDFVAAINKVTMGILLDIVPSVDEKRNTARHEAGHAVLINRSATLAPLTKVNIQPRGHALGVTMFAREKDTFQKTKREMLEELVALLGGQAAEEIYYGQAGVTSGARNDLMRATGLAWSIVAEYGLSEAGLMVINRTPTGAYDCSQETAAEVDRQVKLLLADAKRTAIAMLTESKDLVDRLAAVLMDKETVEADELKTILGPKAEL